MIPESAIIEWRDTVPWAEDAQVEQDLIICRALTAIYQDEFLSKRLAFRGGTALHKLYLSPQPRYSEDYETHPNHLPLPISCNRHTGANPSRQHNYCITSGNQSIKISQ